MFNFKNKEDVEVVDYFTFYIENIRYYSFFFLKELNKEIGNSFIFKRYNIEKMNNGFIVYKDGKRILEYKNFLGIIEPEPYVYVDIEFKKEKSEVSDYLSMLRYYSKK